MAKKPVARTDSSPEPAPKPPTSASELLGAGVEHLETLLGLVRASLASGQELNGQVLRESAGVVRAIATAAAEQRQAQKLRDARKTTSLADVFEFFNRLPPTERSHLIRALTEMNSKRSVLG